MQIDIRPLRPEDAAAVVAAEDERTVQWYSGGVSTLEGTTGYILGLDHDAERGKAKRAFGIWADGDFVGTIDFDPDVTDGLEAGDVNIAYGVASWMRGQGVAGRAVELICEVIRDGGIGTRAVIRADVRNPSSARVAEKAGFVHLRDVDSSTETVEDGSPVVLRVYGQELSEGVRPAQAARSRASR
jgi:RimJ/RimL family protein N-acetyltransferase